MDLRKFVDYLRTEYYKLIATKTGWGKNEIIWAFDKCVGDALINAIDDEKEIKEVKDGE